MSQYHELYIQILEHYVLNKYISYKSEYIDTTIKVENIAFENSIWFMVHQWAGKGQVRIIIELTI